MSGQNFSADIIIVGAGAAGMMAAKTLSAKGLEVAVLEARDRIGGRIYTLPDFAGRSEEGGAEFIHGKLEVTLGLLKDAGVGKQKITGKFWNVTRGTWKQENEFFENYELVIQRLKSLQEDISIAAFLDKEFSEKKYEGLRSSLRSYVEGYYSGEPNRISAKSFLEECLSEDEEQYRPEGGYGNMVQYLKYCCIEAGVTIHLSVAVKEIKWARDEVQLTDESGKLYTAKKVIITVPLGVWIANEQEQGAIRYIPDLPHKTEAAKQMGFGSVLKILIRFKTMFWAEDRFKKLADKTIDNFHMALSDQFIPTWWTQFPDKTPLLTGWLSGPAAAMIEDDENIIFEKALEALQNIFGIAASELKECITGWKVINWTNDPYTRGSYSYATLHTNTARKILLEPVEDTLFFAGEALYDGPEMGTVEAALTSGLEVADQLIAQFFIS